MADESTETNSGRRDRDADDSLDRRGKGILGAGGDDNTDQGEASVTIPDYEIVRELSHGGQGVVYQAVQKSTKRKVAIKVLLEGPYASKSARRRFEREIELVASLKHPNIVSVFHAGTTADGRQFFVMDYLRGVPLTRYVSEKKPALEELLKLFTTICDAIQYAHQKGVIHRDLKPSNIVVDVDGNPKILDFGLAKQVGGPEHTLVSMTGQVVGTLPYMSPEQARGNPDEIDTRTDVYALGVILYELLTGCYPYPVVGQMADVLKHIAETEPTPPSRTWKSDSGVTKRSSKRLKPGQCPIDDEVQTIVLRALTKERDRRYQSAGELGNDVSQYLAGEPIEAKRDSGWYVLKKNLQRYRVPVATIGLGFVVALLALGVSGYYWRQAATDRDLAAAAQKGEAAQRAEATRQRETALVAQGVAETNLAEARRQSYLANILAAQASLRASETKFAKQRIASCPEEYRGWEWRYLNRVADSGLATLDAASWVHSCVFSADGQRIVSAGHRDFIVWDARTQERLSSVDLPDGQSIVGISPDASLMLILEGDEDSGRMVVVERGSGRRIATLGTWTIGLVPAVNFSTAGTRLVYWNASARRVGLKGNEDAEVWDYSSGDLIFIASVSSTFEQFALSPDGRLLAADGTVWDVDTGSKLMSFVFRGFFRPSIPVFSGDGAYLAVAVQNDITLWNVETGELLTRFADAKALPASRITTMAFSPDGRSIVSAGRDGLLRVWDPRTGRELSRMGMHDDWILTVAFSPDGERIVSGSRDGTVRIWDAVLRNDLIEYEEITYAEFSPDGERIATASWFGPTLTGRIWDARTGQPLVALECYNATIASVQFSPDGRFIITAPGNAGFAPESLAENTVCLWDAATGILLKSLPPIQEGYRIESITVHPTQNQIAAGTSKVVRLGAGGFTLEGEQFVYVWDVPSGSLVHRFSGFDAAVYDLDYSPDGRRLVVVDGRATNIVDMATGATVQSFASGGWQTTVAFSPDGQRIAIALRNAIELRDALSGELLGTLRGHGDFVDSIAFSPDGRRIVSADGGLIRLWDADSFDLVLVLRDRAARSVSFSPDGSRLLIAGSNTVRVLNTSQPASAFEKRAEVSREYAAAQRLAQSFLDEFGTAQAASNELASSRAGAAAERRLARQLIRLRQIESGADAHRAPQALNEESWAIVKDATARPEAFSRALAMAQRACTKEPDNGYYLNTLGLAQYRVGEHEKALATLTKSDKKNGGIPADVAFIAMAHHQLSHASEARQALARLRKIMTDPRTRGDADVDSQAFLREAEALIVSTSETTSQPSSSQP